MKKDEVNVRGKANMKKSANSYSERNAHKVNGAVEAPVLIARRRQANKFYATVFLPAVENDPRAAEEGFYQLLADFKKQASSVGSDFEVGHVWAISFEQVNYIEKKAKVPSEFLPQNAKSVKLAFEILTSLELKSSIA